MVRFVKASWRSDERISVSHRYVPLPIFDSSVITQKDWPDFMTLVTREGFIMTVYSKSVVVTVVSSRRTCQTYRSDWWPESREKNREQETLKSMVSKSIQNYSYKKSGEKRALKYFIGTWSVKSRNYLAGPLIKSAPLLLRGIFTFLDRALYPSRQVHLNVTSATQEKRVMSQ